MFDFEFFSFFLLCSSSPQQWRPPPERKQFWLLIKNKKQLRSSILYWPQPCCSTVVALYHCRAGYSALCIYIGRGTPLSCFVSLCFAILFLTVISMPGLLHNILDKCQQLCPPFQWILWALIYITDTANMSYGCIIWMHIAYSKMFLYLLMLLKVTMFVSVLCQHWKWPRYSTHICVNFWHKGFPFKHWLCLFCSSGCKIHEADLKKIF